MSSVSRIPEPSQERQAARSLFPSTFMHMPPYHLPEGVIGGFNWSCIVPLPTAHLRLRDLTRWRSRSRQSRPSPEPRAACNRSRAIPARLFRGSDSGFALAEAGLEFDDRRELRAEGVAFHVPLFYFDIRGGGLCIADRLMGTATASVGLGTGSPEMFSNCSDEGMGL